MLTVEPLATVTTTLDVPAGVPWFGGGPVLLLPPPPHAGAEISIANNTINPIPRTRFRFPPIKTMEKRNPSPPIQCAKKNDCVRRCSRALAAVVETVIVAVVVLAVPFAVIVDGVKLQVASEGRPEQVKLIVPLNPVELMTATEL